MIPGPRRPHRPRRRDAVLASAALLLAPLARGAVVAAGPTAHAPGLGVARESAVKAAFLYKFGSFVEWPASAFRAADAPLVIGVYGDGGVAAELTQLAAGRRLEGRPLEVRQVRGAGELAGLHILFVGGSRRSRMRELLAAVRGPVLTVADLPLEGEPAVLHFVQDGGRVRFGASLPAAQARGLKLSARLLAVARHVEGR